MFSPLAISENSCYAEIPMQSATNKKAPQFVPNGKRRQLPDGLGDTTLRSVRQDKPRIPTARIASSQPAPFQKTMRPHETITKPLRSQKGNEHRRKTIHLTIWVKPGVKAELQRMAASEGLSVSATAAAFLETALQHNLYAHRQALLDPIIDTSIRKHMRSYSTRIAVLLVRAMFEVGQTRAIVANILRRQPGVTATV